jgi:hypothetical protein
MNQKLKNEIINYKREKYNKKDLPTLNELKSQIVYFLPFYAEFNYITKLNMIRMISGMGGLRDAL